MIRSRRVMVLCVSIALLVLLPTAAFATVTAEEMPIETGVERSFDPLVSDGRVAYGAVHQGGWTMWVVDVGSQATVYHTGFADWAAITDFDGPWITATYGVVSQHTKAYNCLTGESFVIGPQVTYPDVKYAQIAGDTIVWTWWRDAGDHPLMATSITESTTASLGSTPGGVTEADGELALFSAPGPFGDADLYGVDLKTGDVTAIVAAPGDQTQPALDGTLLAWRDTGSDLNGDIHLMDLADKTVTRLTSDAAPQGAPDVSGEIVVWEDARGDDPDIFVYSMATGATGSLRAPGVQSSPSVDGDIVAYADGRDPSTASDTYAAVLSFTGPEITNASGPKRLKAEAPGAFRLRLSNPDATDSHTVTWDWGDGTRTTQTDLTAGLVRARHDFDAPGSYTVTATVTDESGASAARRLSVVVR